MFRRRVIETDERAIPPSRGLVNPRRPRAEILDRLLVSSRNRSCVCECVYVCPDNNFRTK